MSASVLGSKRYRKAAGLVDAKKTHSLEEAIAVLAQLPPTKFNETVEISASLNIDPKKTDQIVRGTVVLPHGTGKTRRVAVFCKGEKEMQAKEAGADFAGASELIQQVLDGWLDFDVAVATPDMMREVSKLGKILGPKGMMPNPKTGTVTEDVAKAIKDVKGGKVEFKMDKLSNIHFVIGRRSFQAPQLIENGKAALQAIARARPATLKGKMLRRLSLSSTMSPGILLKTDGLEIETVQE
jgi:large subunit ribosomal protein L1